jgi:hypothetical protein
VENAGAWGDDETGHPSTFNFQNSNFKEDVPKEDAGLMCDKVEDSYFGKLEPPSKISSPSLSLHCELKF